MKILMIINQYPIQPRTKKIINSIKKIYPNVDLKVIAWNRENVNLQDKSDFIKVINSKVGYGKKLKKLIGLNKFKKEIEKEVESFKPDFLHIIDWDMLWICSNFKKYKIIYEVYDIPNCKNFIIEKVYSFLEKKSLKNVDKIIVASKYFFERYSYLNLPIMILENKPLKMDFLETSIIGNRKKICIGYVGKIRNFTILKNIVDACQELNMDILFAGDGPDYKNLKIYCKDKKNVQILGKYDYKDISRIYSNIDIVWAAYPIENKNVKLAVSNRFYEACILKNLQLLLKKLCLVIM
ncbi:hypothetical protein ACV3NO_10100 [Clostridium perfringens]